uniref:Cell division protein n=1 Tax=Nephroselmis astigmatica TaxID=259378 RepID=A0A088CK67_9CHLO|nr:cell division protein [Nephroselmis astigmatica]AID67672.1 cell division protein [Nephroselmis astigmatica]
MNTQINMNIQTNQDQLNKETNGSFLDQLETPYAVTRMERNLYKKLLWRKILNQLNDRIPESRRPKDLEDIERIEWLEQKKQIMKALEPYEVDELKQLYRRPTNPEIIQVQIKKANEMILAKPVRGKGLLGKLDNIWTRCTAEYRLATRLRKTKEGLLIKYKETYLFKKSKGIFKRFALQLEYKFSWFYYRFVTIQTITKEEWSEIFKLALLYQKHNLKVFYKKEIQDSSSATIYSIEKFFGQLRKVDYLRLQTKYWEKVIGSILLIGCLWSEANYASRQKMIANQTSNYAITLIHQPQLRSPNQPKSHPNVQALLENYVPSLDFHHHQDKVFWLGKHPNLFQRFRGFVTATIPERIVSDLAYVETTLTPLDLKKGSWINQIEKINKDVVVRTQAVDRVRTDLVTSEFLFGASLESFDQFIQKRKINYRDCSYASSFSFPKQLISSESRELYPNFPEPYPNVFWSQIAPAFTSQQLQEKKRIANSLVAATYRDDSYHTQPWLRRFLLQERILVGDPVQFSSAIASRKIIRNKKKSENQFLRRKLDAKKKENRAINKDRKWWQPKESLDRDTRRKDAISVQNFSQEDIEGRKSISHYFKRLKKLRKFKLITSHDPYDSAFPKTPSFSLMGGYQKWRQDTLNLHAKLDHPGLKFLDYSLAPSHTDQILHQNLQSQLEILIKNLKTLEGFGNVPDLSPDFPIPHGRYNLHKVELSPLEDHQNTYLRKLSQISDQWIQEAALGSTKVFAKVNADQETPDNWTIDLLTILEHRIWYLLKPRDPLDMSRALRSVYSLIPERNDFFELLDEQLFLTPKWFHVPSSLLNTPRKPKTISNEDAREFYASLDPWHHQWFEAPPQDQTGLLLIEAYNEMGKFWRAREPEYLESRRKRREKAHRQYVERHTNLKDKFEGFLARGVGPQPVEKPFREVKRTRRVHTFWHELSKMRIRYQYHLADVLSCLETCEDTHKTPRIRSSKMFQVDPDTSLTTLESTCDTIQTRLTLLQKQVALLDQGENYQEMYQEFRECAWHYFLQGYMFKLFKKKAKRQLKGFFLESVFKDVFEKEWMATLERAFHQTSPVQMNYHLTRGNLKALVATKKISDRLIADLLKSILRDDPMRPKRKKSKFFPVLKDPSRRMRVGVGESWFPGLIFLADQGLGPDFREMQSLLPQIGQIADLSIENLSIPIPSGNKMAPDFNQANVLYNLAKEQNNCLRDTKQNLQLHLFSLEIWNGVYLSQADNTLEDPEELKDIIPISRRQKIQRFFRGQFRRKKTFVGNQSDVYWDEKTKLAEAKQWLNFLDFFSGVRKYDGKEYVNHQTKFGSFPYLAKKTESKLSRIIKPISSINLQLQNELLATKYINEMDDLKSLFVSNVENPPLFRKVPDFKNLIEYDYKMKGLVERMIEAQEEINIERLIHLNDLYLTTHVPELKEECRKAYLEFQEVANQLDTEKSKLELELMSKSLFEKQLQIILPKEIWDIYSSHRIGSGWVKLAHLQRSLKEPKPHWIDFWSSDIQEKDIEKQHNLIPFYKKAEKFRDLHQKESVNQTKNTQLSLEKYQHRDLDSLVKQNKLLEQLSQQLNLDRSKQINFRNYLSNFHQPQTHLSKRNLSHKRKKFFYRLLHRLEAISLPIPSEDLLEAFKKNLNLFQDIKDPISIPLNIQTSQSTEPKDLKNFFEAKEALRERELANKKDDKDQIHKGVKSRLPNSQRYDQFPPSKLKPNLSMELKLFYGALKYRGSILQGLLDISEQIEVEPINFSHEKKVLRRLVMEHNAYLVLYLGAKETDLLKLPACWMGVDPRDKKLYSSSKLQNLDPEWTSQVILLTQKLKETQRAILQKTVSGTSPAVLKSLLTKRQQIQDSLEILSNYPRPSGPPSLLALFYKNEAIYDLLIDKSKDFREKVSGMVSGLNKLVDYWPNIRVLFEERTGGNITQSPYIEAHYSLREAEARVKYVEALLKGLKNTLGFEEEGISQKTFAGKIVSEKISQTEQANDLVPLLQKDGWNWKSFGKVFSLEKLDFIDAFYFARPKLGQPSLDSISMHKEEKWLSLGSRLHNFIKESTNSKFNLNAPLNEENEDLIEQERQEEFRGILEDWEKTHQQLICLTDEWNTKGKCLIPILENIALLFEAKKKQQQYYLETLRSTNLSFEQSLVSMNLKNTKFHLSLIERINQPWQFSDRLECILVRNWVSLTYGLRYRLLKTTNLLKKNLACLYDAPLLNQRRHLELEEINEIYGTRHTSLEIDPDENFEDYEHILWWFQSPELLEETLITSHELLKIPENLSVQQKSDQPFKSIREFGAAVANFDLDTELLSLCPQYRVMRNPLTWRLLKEPERLSETLRQVLQDIASKHTNLPTAKRRKFVDSKYDDANLENSIAPRVNCHKKRFRWPNWRKKVLKVSLADRYSRRNKLFHGSLRSAHATIWFNELLQVSRVALMNKFLIPALQEGIKKVETAQNLSPTASLIRKDLSKFPPIFDQDGTQKDLNQFDKISQINRQEENNELWEFMVRKLASRSIDSISAYQDKYISPNYAKFKSDPEFPGKLPTTSMDQGKLWNRSQDLVNYYGILELFKWPNQNQLEEQPKIAVLGVWNMLYRTYLRDNKIFELYTGGFDMTDARIKKKLGGNRIARKSRITIRERTTSHLVSEWLEKQILYKSFQDLYNEEFSLSFDNDLPQSSLPRKSFDICLSKKQKLNKKYQKDLSIFQQNWHESVPRSKNQLVNEPKRIARKRVKSNKKFPIRQAFSKKKNSLPFVFHGTPLDPYSQTSWFQTKVAPELWLTGQLYGDRWRDIRDQFGLVKSISAPMVDLHDHFKLSLLQKKQYRLGTEYIGSYLAEKKSNQTLTDKSKRRLKKFFSNMQSSLDPVDSLEAAIGQFIGEPQAPYSDLAILNAARIFYVPPKVVSSLLIRSLKAFHVSVKTSVRVTSQVVKAPVQTIKILNKIEKKMDKLPKTLALAPYNIFSNLISSANWKKVGTKIDDKTDIVDKVKTIKETGVKTTKKINEKVKQVGAKIKGKKLTSKPVSNEINDNLKNNQIDKMTQKTLLSEILQERTQKGVQFLHASKELTYPLGLMDVDFARDSLKTKRIKVPIVVAQEPSSLEKATHFLLEQLEKDSFDQQEETQDHLPGANDLQDQKNEKQEILNLERNMDAQAIMNAYINKLQVTCKALEMVDWKAWRHLLPEQIVELTWGYLGRPLEDQYFLETLHDLHDNTEIVHQTSCMIEAAQNQKIGQEAVNAYQKVIEKLQARKFHFIMTRLKNLGVQEDMVNNWSFLEDPSTNNLLNDMNPFIDRLSDLVKKNLNSEKSSLGSKAHPKISSKVSKTIVAWGPKEQQYQVPQRSEDVGKLLDKGLGETIDPNVVESQYSIPQDDKIAWGEVLGLLQEPFDPLPEKTLKEALQDFKYFLPRKGEWLDRKAKVILINDLYEALIVDRLFPQLTTTNLPMNRWTLKGHMEALKREYLKKDTSSRDNSISSLLEIHQNRKRALKEIENDCYESQHLRRMIYFSNHGERFDHFNDKSLEAKEMTFFEKEDRAGIRIPRSFYWPIEHHMHKIEYEPKFEKLLKNNEEFSFRRLVNKIQKDQDYKDLEDRDYKDLKDWQEFWCQIYTKIQQEDQDYEDLEDQDYKDLEVWQEFWRQRKNRALNSHTFSFYPGQTSNSSGIKLFRKYRFLPRVFKKLGQTSRYFLSNSINPWQRVNKEVEGPKKYNNVQAYQSTLKQEEKSYSTETDKGSNKESDQNKVIVGLEQKIQQYIDAEDKKMKSLYDEASNAIPTVTAIQLQQALAEKEKRVPYMIRHINKKLEVEQRNQAFKKMTPNEREELVQKLAKEITDRKKDDIDMQDMAKQHVKEEQVFNKSHQDWETRVALKRAELERNSKRDTNKKRRQKFRDVADLEVEIPVQKRIDSKLDSWEKLTRIHTQRWYPLMPTDPKDIAVEDLGDQKERRAFYRKDLTFLPKEELKKLERRSRTPDHRILQPYNNYVHHLYGLSWMVEDAREVRHRFNCDKELDEEEATELEGEMFEEIIFELIFLDRWLLKYHNLYKKCLNITWATPIKIDLELAKIRFRMLSQFQGNPTELPTPFLFEPDDIYKPGRRKHPDNLLNFANSKTQSLQRDLFYLSHAPQNICLTRPPNFIRLVAMWGIAIWILFWTAKIYWWRWIRFPWLLLINYVQMLRGYGTLHPRATFIVKKEPPNDNPSHAYDPQHYWVLKDLLRKRGNINCLDDLAGIGPMLRDLYKIAFLFQKQSSWFKDHFPLPSGILMVGPPGTGKTVLAQAVAGEAKIPLLVVAGGVFETDDEKNGPHRLHMLFELARQQAPCILFLDELDSLAVKREGMPGLRLNIPTVGFGLVEDRTKYRWQTWSPDEMIDQKLHEHLSMYHHTQFDTKVPIPRLHGKGFHLYKDSLEDEDKETETDKTEKKRVQKVEKKYEEEDAEVEKNLFMVTQFLIELDGARRSNEGLLVIGATNRPSVIDQAVTRPGRLGEVMEVGIPDQNKRLEIMRFYGNQYGMEPNYDWQHAANRTSGLTPADLTAIMNDSLVLAILKNYDYHTIETLDLAVARIINQYRLGRKAGISDSSMLNDPMIGIRSAYYQAGKAVIHTCVPFHPPFATLFLSPTSLLVGKHELSRRLVENHIGDYRLLRCVLEATLTGCLAGQVAEGLMLETLVDQHGKRGSSWRWMTNYGQEDIEMATSLAQYIGEHWNLTNRTVGVAKFLRHAEDSADLEAWTKKEKRLVLNSKYLILKSWLLGQGALAPVIRDTILNEENEYQESRVKDNKGQVMFHHRVAVNWWQRFVAKNIHHNRIDAFWNLLGHKALDTYVHEKEATFKPVVDMFYHSFNQPHSFLNQQFANHRDKDIQVVIEKSTREAHRILTKSRHFLDFLAAQCLSEGMLRGTDVTWQAQRFIDFPDKRATFTSFPTSIAHPMVNQGWGNYSVVDSLDFTLADFLEAKISKISKVLLICNGTGLLEEDKCAKVLSTIGELRHNLGKKGYYDKKRVNQIVRFGRIMYPLAIKRLDGLRTRLDQEIQELVTSVPTTQSTYPAISEPLIILKLLSKPFEKSLYTWWNPPILMKKEEKAWIRELLGFLRHRSVQLSGDHPRDFGSELRKHLNQEYREWNRRYFQISSRFGKSCWCWILTKSLAIERVRDELLVDRTIVWLNLSMPMMKEKRFRAKEHWKERVEMMYLLAWLHEQDATQRAELIEHLEKVLETFQSRSNLLSDEYKKEDAIEFYRIYFAFLRVYQGLVEWDKSIPNDIPNDVPKE